MNLKDKTDKKSKNVEPKIKDKQTISKIILKAISWIILLFLFLYFNGSIVYILKEIGIKDLLKKFPIDCDKYPYGNKDTNPCNINDNSIIKEVIKEVSNKCKDIPAIPYRYYTNKYETLYDKYVNWFIGSLIITQIGLHKHIYKIILWIRNQPIFTSFILLIFGILLLKFGLFITAIYVFFVLIYNQIRLAYKIGGFLNILLIICTSFIVLSINHFISIIVCLKIIWDMILEPLINKNTKGRVHKIIFTENKILVGYLLGFVFLQILNYISFNKHYDKIIKLIPNIIYYTIVIIHLFRYLYNLFKTINFGGSKNKCN